MTKYGWESTLTFLSLRVQYENDSKFVCIKMIPIPNHGTALSDSVITIALLQYTYFSLPCKNVPPPLPLSIKLSFHSFFFPPSANARASLKSHEGMSKRICERNRNGTFCAEIFTTLKMHLWEINIAVAIVRISEFSNVSDTCRNKWVFHFMRWKTKKFLGWSLNI